MVGFLPSHLSWYQNSLKYSFVRKLFIWSEELLLPGDLMHIICRKYYMTKMVDEGISNDIEQVVSMGAGFDHLAAYTANKGLTSFELDMNWMIDHKRAFIDEYGYARDQLITLTADFNKQRLADVLSSHSSFDSTKKTLFIGEGFFDYLPLETGKEILADIKSLNSQNELLSTYFSLDELSRFHRFSFTSGVSLVGESLRFPLNRAEFIELLSSYGFTVDSEITYQEMINELVKSIGLSLPVLKGFYIIKSS